jgi:hypothetical protein
MYEFFAELGWFNLKAICAAFWVMFVINYYIIQLTKAIKQIKDNKEDYKFPFSNN